MIKVVVVVVHIVVELVLLHVRVLNVAVEFAIVLVVEYAVVDWCCCALVHSMTPWSCRAAAGRHRASGVGRPKPICPARVTVEVGED